MKKKLLLALMLLCGIGIANAAVRDQNSIRREQQKTTTQRQTASTIRTNTARSTQPARTIQARQTTIPTNNNRKIASRPNTTNVTKPNTHRAGITLTTPASNTFDTDYNTCRMAYFTCMDQFCGTMNDTYRRCICSPKLTEIQSRERALSQTSDQLQDFKNYNIYAIDKTAAEVGAMISASEGEKIQENASHNNISDKTLSTITEVLSKSKSDTTHIENDFSSSINISWGTSDLIGGTNIANLTGEALYNTVNAQCIQMISDQCPNQTTIQMVTAAYGMYIENDCSLLISSLDSKLKSANSEIRKTGYEMENARLKNYNTHNSSSINDCLAMIRNDITASTACGSDYVHCLDVTGKYLNYQTGEPIYSGDFYELDSATSLSGDILTNNANNMFITELNNKKIFAQRSLDTCRDLSGEIWDEFLRQAITEIHQAQQERIRNVKNECLSVVVSCYDEQNKQLIDFSNIDEQKLLGMRLELSEEMCSEKLTTCSNLYGGGPNGMAELLSAMHNIVSEKIGNKCLDTLTQYTETLCTPSQYEGTYTFPFECRAYAPGNEICATKSDYTSDKINCADYDNSLYQNIAQYALEMCIRPSEKDNGLTAPVLHDINTVFSNIRAQMSIALAAECEQQNGKWILYSNDPTQTQTKNQDFYSKTGAHDKWGICVIK